MVSAFRASRQPPLLQNPAYAPAIIYQSDVLMICISLILSNIAQVAVCVSHCFSQAHSTTVTDTAIQAPKIMSGVDIGLQEETLHMTGESY